MRCAVFPKSREDVVGGDPAVGGYVQNSVVLLRNAFRGDLVNALPGLGVDLLAQRLIMEFYKDDSYHNTNTVCLLSLLFSHLIRDQQEYAISYDFSDSSSGNLNMAMLIQYIRQNYKTVTLAQLSRRFHYSESFLSRLIMKRTGEGFSGIIKQVKLERAEELLLHSDYSIQTISDAVGYESPYHVQSCF